MPSHETTNGNIGYPSCFQKGSTCFCDVSVYGFPEFRPAGSTLGLGYLTPILLKYKVILPKFHYDIEECACNFSLHDKIVSKWKLVKK